MSDEYASLIEQLDTLVLNTARESIATTLPQTESTATVCYVYDEAMTQHCGDKNHPERPDRIRTIHEHLQRENLLSTTRNLDSRLATRDEICLAHSGEMVDRVTKLEANFDDPAENNGDVLVKQKQIMFPFDADTYVCHSTPAAARMACGSVLNVVDCVMTTACSRGFAAIRPPGHHACFDKSMGFCLFNNVAVAAAYARKRYGLNKVAIIDWDVHHGNGTTDIFHTDPNVLFISIHRYDKGKFYPSTGHAHDIGSEAGRGFNINLPIDGSFGDEEILYCWDRVVLPALLDFKPELVLVSAGFDAAENDPLGLCRVRCGTYGILVDRLIETMTSPSLFEICKNRLMLVLEGGYNLNSIAAASRACMKSLLGDSPLSSPTGSGSDKSTLSTGSKTSSIRSVPGGVPKTSVIKMVHELTSLLNTVPGGVKPPVSPAVHPYASKADIKQHAAKERKKQPAPTVSVESVEAAGRPLLHSGGGHVDAVVRFDDEHIVKSSTVREALCYLLIAEATGQDVSVEVADGVKVDFTALLREEKIRIQFESTKSSFVKLALFTCRCKKVIIRSATNASVVLEDLTHGLASDDSLGVVDIKLGTEYHTPEDLPARVLTRRQKATVTSASTLGIRITACRCNSGFSVSKHKAAKLKLMEQMVPLFRRVMFGDTASFDRCHATASAFAAELKTAFESSEIGFRFIASSILFAVGVNASGDQEMRCKMIDLAHLFPNEPGKEDGMVLGLRNLALLLDQVKEPSYESA